MEGMEKVHDGSGDGIGYGYWLSNIIATNRSGENKGNYGYRWKIEEVHRHIKMRIIRKIFK